MGFQPPNNVRVPLIEIGALNGARFGVWAYYNSGFGGGAVGAFVKEKGAADFTLVATPVVLNFREDELKQYLQSKYASDERAFLKAEIETPINAQLDKYFRDNYSWEAGMETSVLDANEIDALASGFDQVNHTLAGYGAIMADPTTKTIQFYI